MNCFNMIDTGYLQLAKNQALNFGMPHMQNHTLHLVCMDEVSYVSMQTFIQVKQVENVKLTHVPISKFGGRELSYGDSGFRELMRLRPRIFMQMAKELGGALHTEADVFWFQDPENLVKDAGDFDWLMQHDASGPDYHVAWLNIGCTYYSSTPGSMKMFELWIKHHDSSSLMDQEALCELLQTTVDPAFRLFPILEEGFDFRDATQKLNVSIKCFDKRLVQNGHCAFKEGYINLHSPAAIHVNHHSGVGKKIELLKSCGAWIYGGD